MSAHFTIRRVVPNYSKYNLKFNPFPASATPEENPRIFADQNKAKEQINTILSNVIFSGQRPVHTLITGDYGNGKSHILKVIRTSVLEDLYPNNEAIAAYVQLSDANFLKLFKDFMTDFDQKFFEDFSKKIGQHICRVLGVPESEIRSKDFITFLYKEISDLDLATALYSMYVSEDSFRIAHKWICGEWINLYTLRRYGIINRIDTNDKAFSTFINFRKLISLVDINMLIFCIDEVENIIYLSDNERIKLLESIRHLMDWNPRGMNLIMSVSPEALASIRNYPPLDRIAAIIEIESLSEENVDDYVSAYLNEYRIEKSGDPLHPFNSEINKKILDILVDSGARVNIRNYLKLCYYVIEISVSNDKDIVDDEVLSELVQRDDIYLG